MALASYMAVLSCRAPQQVMQLSRLYESAPAYVTDQPTFLNAAALVYTRLGPLRLLETLKSIEAQVRSKGFVVAGAPAGNAKVASGISSMVCLHLTPLPPNGMSVQLGRDFGGQRYGPRPIDLDIIFYEGVELRWARCIACCYIAAANLSRRFAHFGLSTDLPPQ